MGIDEENEKRVTAVKTVYPKIPYGDPVRLAAFWILWYDGALTCEGIAEGIGCTVRETQRALDFLTTESGYYIGVERGVKKPLYIIGDYYYEENGDGTYTQIVIGNPMDEFSENNDEVESVPHDKAWAEKTILARGNVSVEDFADALENLGFLRKSA